MCTVSGYHTSIIEKAQHLGTKCNQSQLVNACQVKTIHDLVEEIAYKALAEVVQTLNITGDTITEEQSGMILAHIKKKAHQQMYRKDGGYIKERAVLLQPCQIQHVLRNVGRIVHERDTKLTFGRYRSLTELVMALDDHNLMVKDILLQSWYQVDSSLDEERQHLEHIKNRINFYETVNPQIGFDLQESTQQRRTFYDTYFPGLRCDDRSYEFVNIIEVRGFFGGDEKVTIYVDPDGEHCLELSTSVKDYYCIRYTNSNDKLIDVIDCDEIKNQVFEPRQVFNKVKNKFLEAPALLDRNITVGEFITKYFPDKI